VRHDYVGCLCFRDAGVERSDNGVGERPAEHSRGHERRDREGAIPAKVSENIRPMAMAGLAKLVELVNQ
jgi:hypothetical protein